jgi:hypothetical protein
MFKPRVHVETTIPSAASRVVRADAGLTPLELLGDADDETD